MGGTEASALLCSKTAASATTTTTTMMMMAECGGQDNASALLFPYNAHFVIKFYKRKN